MTVLFDASGAFHEIRASNESALRGTSFGINQPIGNRNVLFEFRWNTRFGRYSVTMSDSKGDFFQFFPEVGTEEMLRNFDPGNADAPDLFIGVASIEPSQPVITPRNIGVTHSLFAVSGRIVR